MAKEIVEKQDTQLAMSGFEGVSVTGFAEVGAEDMSIPFLRILDKGSPQVNKRDGAYVEGAEAGMIYNTVANEVYDGEQGVEVIPCHYNRRYVEWKPREQGGGYVKSYETTDPIVNTIIRNEVGQDVLPNGNLLANTAQFFVLLLHPTMGAQRALITMSSTQLKKARKWMTQAQSLTAQGDDGVFVLPLMSQVYKVGTVQEQNDKGTWFGFDVTRVRSLDLENKEDEYLFNTALQFEESIQAGEVEVKEDKSANTAKEKGDAPDDDIPF